MAAFNPFNGAAPVYVQGNLASERNPGTANQYGVAVPECNVTRLDIGTTETLVTASPCIVLGVIGNEGNTGFTDLIDAGAVASGNTPVVRCDVAAGGQIDLHGAKFNAGLCVDGENAAHDVTIFWRPQ